MSADREWNQHSSPSRSRFWPLLQNFVEEVSPRLGCEEQHCLDETCWSCPREKIIVFDADPVSVLHAFGDQSLGHDFPLQSVHWNHYESLFVMAWEYLLLASSCFVSNFIRHCLEFQTFSNRLEIRTLCVFLSFQDTERMSLRRQACAGQWWELGFCSSTCMLVLSRCLLKLSGLHFASGSSDSSAPELNMRSRVPARTHVLLMS